jgi:hypothetical protein
MRDGFDSDGFGGRWQGHYATAEAALAALQDQVNAGR